jgi:formylglycine-generating enzyme required for sulfatase activity
MTDKITGEVKKRFVDNGDGTVTDLSTNLMWLQAPKQVSVSYEEAQQYCQELTVKGYEGWRLPTVSEWKDMMDKTQQNPSLPPGHPFGNVPTQIGYWSKTKHKFGPMYVYQVSLWYGKTAHISKKKRAHVWPVRYAAVTK